MQFRPHGERRSLPIQISQHKPQSSLNAISVTLILFVGAAIALFLPRYELAQEANNRRAASKASENKTDNESNKSLTANDQHPYSRIPQAAREQFVKQLNMFLAYRRDHRWGDLYELISEKDIRGRTKTDFIEYFTRHPGVGGTEREFINFSSKSIAADPQQVGGWIIGGCAQLEGLRFPVDAFITAEQQNKEWRFSDIGMITPRDTNFVRCEPLEKGRESASNAGPTAGATHSQALIKKTSRTYGKDSPRSIANHTLVPNAESKPERGEDYVRQLLKTLEPDNTLRFALQQGSRGDGIHYWWMDVMRSFEINQAAFVIDFEYRGTPTNLRIREVDYLKHYYRYDTAIKDASALERIRSTGLAQGLESAILKRAREFLRAESKVLKEDSKGRALCGTLYVNMLDDEVLPILDEIPDWDPCSSGQKEKLDSFELSSISSRSLPKRTSRVSRPMNNSNAARSRTGVSVNSNQTKLGQQTRNNPRNQSSVAEYSSMAQGQTPKIPDELLKPLRLSRELRERLIQRFDLFIAYEKAHAYENQYDLWAKDYEANLLRLNPTKENYVRMKKEIAIAGGQVIAISVDKIESTSEPVSSLSFSTTFELRKEGRTYFDSPVFVAFLINGDWYFSIIHFDT